MVNQHRQIWNRFCDRHNVRGTWVPMFEVSTDGIVITKRIGKVKERLVLCRSGAMERLVRSECNKLIEDWKAKVSAYDGLIYFMVVEEAGDIVPLYIGKTETFGKGDGNLSANIKGIERDTSKFARWGDNYAYHIGDLSAVVLPGHDPKHIELKYRAWADALFKGYPSEAPVLQRPVYFWAKAWSGSEVGALEELGPTRLTFLEYQLIGVASSAFGESLLNREGQNR
jgi:hypothetical protein